MVKNYLVIEAQIPIEEELRTKASLQFPTVNTSTEDSSVLGDMTPMIEIPTTIVLRELAEGVHIYKCVYILHICIYTSTYLCVHAQYAYIHMHVHKNVATYIYICMYLMFFIEICYILMCAHKNIITISYLRMFRKTVVLIDT